MQWQVASESQKITGKRNQEIYAAWAFLIPA
jgi:hypothetical protein